MNPTNQRNILIILIPSSILIVLWIIFSVYNRAITSTLTSTQSMAIQPIAPRFDTDVITQLKARTVVKPELTIDTSTRPVSGASQAGTLTPQPPPALESDTSASPGAEEEGGTP